MVENEEIAINIISIIMCVIVCARYGVKNITPKMTEKRTHNEFSNYESTNLI